MDAGEAQQPGPDGQDAQSGGARQQQGGATGGGPALQLLWRGWHGHVRVPIRRRSGQAPTRSSPASRWLAAMKSGLLLAANQRLAVGPAGPDLLLGVPELCAG